MSRSQIRVHLTLMALFLLALTTATEVPASESSLPLDRIQLPEGFRIDLVARVRNAREMTWGAKGTLFVGSSSAGDVSAITFDDSGAARVATIASGLNMPVGVAFKDGALYVSAVDRIVRYDDIESHLDRSVKAVIVSDRFPRETHHGWKFIAFGPDGKLYVPVGAPCNICEPDPDRYANIMRMNPDGSSLEVFARGIRNTVGFDWDPATRELWFTNNGRDMMGDDVPPDTLNHAAKPGLNFGYPYCHAGTIADPEFGKRKPCSDFTPPARALGPHVASLGMRFYTGNSFPPQYKGQIFIAEHGSWNRSEKIGYRVTLVRLQNGKAASYETFASGWLNNGSAWGRPADVLVAPDGSLLVSDDYAGAIYRISYAPRNRQ